jgi:hypothetical protein
MFSSASSQNSVRVSFYPFGYCNNLITSSFSVSPQYELVQHPSGMLCRFNWQFDIDISGQPPVPIFFFACHPWRRKLQAVQNCWKLTTDQYSEVYLKSEHLSLKQLLLNNLYGNLTSKHLMYCSGGSNSVNKQTENCITGNVADRFDPTNWG